MKSPLHILHLEDNPGDAELIQDIFETEGIVSHVTRVETQADFLTSLQEGCFDLILADYSLPSFDGLSALKLAQEKCPNVPFIFVSATLGEEVAIEALKLGSTDYVLKDRLSRITPAVQRALREAEERTQRKRAEEALRESEEQWRDVFEHNPTMYFILDPDGIVLSVNPFGAEQLGYRVDELIGDSVLKVFYKPDRESGKEKVALCLEQPGRSMSWELRKIRKNGTMLWVRETARAALRANGPIVLVACEDITDRKRAEEELAKTEQRLRAVIANVPIILFALDHSGVFTLSEGRGLDDLGLKPGQIVGQSLFDVYRDAPHVLSNIRRALARASAGESFTELLELSGLVFETHYARVLDEDGQVTGVNGLAINITERKRAEQELSERERRYRYIFQATGVSIWEEDFSQVKAAIDDLKAQGVRDFRHYLAAHPEFVGQAISTVKVVDVNDSTISLFEAGSKHQLLVSLDQIFLPQTEEVFAGELIAIAEGRNSFESETVLQTLKGNKLIVLFTVTFPPQPARFDSVLVSIIDITERKRVESELWRLQLEMGRVERLAALGKMTGAIAHELGTPLNSVLGYTQLLAGEDLSESARRRVAVIETQIHRMVEVIQHYLSHSRRSAPTTRINVNDLIRETLVLLQPIFQQHGIEVTTALAESPPPLFGDWVSLQRVLTNLIDNAVDASAGKGRISIKTVMTPSSAGKVPSVTIEIADKGAGIPAEILPKIFDLFVTSKPPGKGTGMGLAISQEIIKAHGGTIKVSSQVGQGTSVQIFLPIEANARESVMEKRA